MGFDVDRLHEVRPLADGFTAFGRKNNRRTKTQWPTLPRGCRCARTGGHRYPGSKADGTSHRTSGRMSGEHRPGPRRRLRTNLVQSTLGFLLPLLVGPLFPLPSKLSQGRWIRRRLFVRVVLNPTALIVFGRSYALGPTGAHRLR